MHVDIEIKTENIHLILQRSEPCRVEQVGHLELRIIGSPDVCDVLEILKIIRVEVRQLVLEEYYLPSVERDAAFAVDRQDDSLCFRPIHNC